MHNDFRAVLVDRLQRRWSVMRSAGRVTDQKRADTRRPARPDRVHRRIGTTVGVPVEQIRVLHRSGLVDLRRPDRIIANSRTLKALGPIAGGVQVSARRDPDRIAVIDNTIEMTYRQLDRHTNSIARDWMVSGIGASATIAVLCRDSVDLVSSMIAAGKVGARLVLMNTGFSGHQLSDVADREEVTAFVYDDEFTPIMASIRPHQRLRPTPSPSRSRRSDRPLPPPRRQGQFVLLTGGTTGTPKGATRKIESPLAAAQFVDRVPLGRNQTILLCAPLFHGTALSQFVLALNLGSTIVLHGRFDAHVALHQLARHGCDVVVLVPTMLRRIVEVGESTIRRFDTTRLRVVFIAGAPLTPSLGNAATALFGPCIHNFYGCTETGTATVATPDDWAAAPGTVGRPPVGITVALYDGAERVTVPDRRGTVHVGNSIAFQGGYSGGGDKAVRDGLMSTGDVGHWDAQGRLFIDGRDDDMIVSGGENVFPGEVEDLLAAHPDVVEVSVTGVSDDEFGQRLAAFVVGRRELTPHEVREYVRSRLARFKVPRDVIFVEELPRTPTGKIDRRGLAAIHSEWVTTSASDVTPAPVKG